MWRDHFEQVYNSVDDDGFKMLFYDRLANHNACTVPFVITIHDVLECARKQKTGKAVGLLTVLQWPRVLLNLNSKKSE